MSARLRLDDLVPDDVFVGASLIIRRDGRMLYGVRPPRIETNETVLELTGIGGGIEDDDESLSACARREALEEIGCDVSIIAAPTTFVVRRRTDVERMALDGDEQPVAVVFRNHRTPPRDPWHDVNAGRACLVVFGAELADTPWPAMELPHLIWVTPEHIRLMAQEDVVLAQMLKTGAELIKGSSEPPSLDLAVRLTDSHEALAIALQGDVSACFSPETKR